MTTQVKKAGRKSNAELAAIAAAVKTQEIAKIEIVDGKKVVTDLEPVSGPIDADTEIKAVLEAPVSSSVDPDGEDLGDVTNQVAKTPVIEAGELVAVIEQMSPGVPVATVDEYFLAPSAYTIDESFTPILVPTMVGDERKGHIPCPKSVFDLVQVEGWQDLIDDQPTHIKAGLKSVLHWKNINGTARVRCQSSSRFADVV